MNLPLADWPTIQILAEIAGLIVGLFILLLVYIQLRRSNDEKARANALARYENYARVQQQFNSGRASQFINCLTDPAQVANFTRADIDYYLGLFEEIQILVKSNLLSRNMAYYMFGEYAEEAQQVLLDTNARNSPHRKLFTEFCTAAETYKQSVATNNDLSTAAMRF